MLTCGVDDAGRGAVIGPLIVAGVLVDERELKEIRQLGVRDSKQVSPAQRRRLAQKIKEIARLYHIVRLNPVDIDHVVETGGKLHRLNRLEAKAMAEVVRVLKPNIAYVDASDVLPDRFRRHIAEEVPFNLRIISEHKADETYPIVSAASIIAKFERDEEIQQLRDKYKDLGSGYVSDQKTVRFLKKWMAAHGSYPSFVRKSWKPAKRIKASYDTSQKRLI